MIVLLLLLPIVLVSCTVPPKITLEQAKALYDTGEKEKAKEAFIALSKQGNYNADFELAYRYTNNYDDEYTYYRNAALHGHEKALTYFLDRALFRSNSLVRTNPQDALYVYKKHLQARNSAEHEEKQQLDFLTMCASIPELDIPAFCKKYAVNYDEAHTKSLEQPYYIWQLAEEASRNNGRFGKPNPELILQLILRGGEVPAELTAAVKDFYTYYQKNEVHEFRIDDYVTSGYGLNFCSRRAQDTVDTFYTEKTRILLQKFSKDNQKHFLNALESYHTYIDTKIWSEEGHDGTGYISWAHDSAEKQKKEFFEYIEHLLSIQHLTVSGKKSNDMLLELEKLKQQRDARLKKLPVESLRFTITLEDEHTIDTLWETYRMNLVNLIENHCNAITAEEVNIWICQKRIEDLNNLIELCTFYPIKN